MKMNKLLNFAFAAVVGLGLIGAPVAATAAPAETPPAKIAAASDTRPAAQTTSDASRYAEREKNAGAQEDFRGGGASIYIGGSALTIALVIILLIIIL